MRHFVHIPPHTKYRYYAKKCVQKLCRLLGVKLVPRIALTSIRIAQPTKPAKTQKSSTAKSIILGNLGIKGTLYYRVCK